MGFMGLLRGSSSGVRALRSRGAGIGSVSSVRGSRAPVVGAVECSRSSSNFGVAGADCAWNSFVAHYRSGSRISEITKSLSSFSAAPLSTLSCSRASLFPSAVRSLLEPNFGGVGSIGQQLDASSMQQKRGLSKLKKYKMKAYSSYKERFKLMADGTYKRWRSGTRHNAHSKTAKQRRQLRIPSIAPLALAKVMKKLNFMG
ncbi:large subunit ribosomal protein L35 [Marchantia polymorpha subsp. ruderalis]|uniref:50S ribosomal protein L35 n=2 Tax=Marchantia polymorpha TaxID=3197 RepID=A0A176W7K1_MARPO|nr:hypothetical protein AXG93_638s1040 [Marchantia polymorpha subsp. ruderalis]PTQ43324.1 hypothetical protein MARPO_0025s0027 [Marchantia polymorpha]BBN03811.1 hypothetical protein Mp_2g26570 [Marchantia polymorpha subsp. ruderalis]|eukprot:PTQ43324.1 hypothetical protein MARPO_0025s0027 [Marchantia polymorpha]